MLLDDLYHLVETLQNRIDAHAVDLRKNEALTRYALIDPLLRGLGWDTADPSQVLVEFRSPSGAADYALLGADGQPLVIVEAKKLGTPLEAAVGQVINYCIHDGFEYFAVTDGRHWELYETNRPGTLSDRMAMQLDLSLEAASTCLNSLALWRPSLRSGQINRPSAPIAETGVPSVIVSDSTLPRPPAEPMPESSTKEVLSHRQRRGMPRMARSAHGIDDTHSWIPLASLDPGTGNKPAALRFPTGEAVTTVTWKDMAVTIAQWLCDRGQLREDHLPITTSGGGRTIVASTQSGSGGRKLFVKSEALHAQVPIYIETNMSARDLVSSANTVVARIGMNPADFAVRLQ